MSENNPLVTLIKKSVGLPAGKSSCCGSSPSTGSSDCCGTPAPQESSTEGADGGCGGDCCGTEASEGE